MHDHVTCPKCNHAFSPVESTARPDRAPGDARGGIVGKPVELAGDSSTGQAPPLVKPASRSASPLAAVVRWATVAGAFVAMVAGAVLLLFLRVDRPADAPAAPHRPETVARPASAAGRSTSRRDDLARVVPRIVGSVVKIESVGAGEKTLGCGFVVDPRGLIATNYHVVSSATRGRARFKSGAVYDIAGYAAVDPANDLALLVLRDAPPNLTPLPLRAEGDPAVMSQVAAIGHPRGVSFSSFDGRVSRLLNTDDLPEDSRRFLHGHMNSNRNHRWIQHTAGTSEGNSGGPLVNARGEVVGVNTWVNTDTNYSYALHARYLAELLAKDSDEVAPLQRYASGAARSRAQFEQLAVGRIRRLYDEAAAMHWRPADEAQYEVLGRLAGALTIVGGADDYAAGQIDAELREQLIREADQVEQLLRKQRFDDVGQFTIINDFAAERVGQPMTGLFCFGTVEGVFSGEADTKGMLVRLAGADETLFISLTGSLLAPEAGEHCLILGICSGRSVRFGANPLQPKTAAEVISRTILPLK